MGQNNDILSDLNQVIPSPESSIELESSSELISSESSLSRAEIPSSTSSKPSQRRLKFKRALITPEEAN
jgi:hypothetical protein